MNYRDIIKNAPTEAEVAAQREQQIAELEAKKAEWLATDPQKAPAGRAAWLRMLNRQLRELRA